MEEKIQPQDNEAEQSVLGSLMLSRDAVAIAWGRIGETDFYRPSHGLIFQAMTELYKQEEPLDLVTVSAQLKKMNALDRIGGSSYLAEIADSVPTAANIEKYVDIVKEKALLRRLITKSSEIIKEAYEDTKHVKTVLEMAQKDILDLTRQTVREEFIALKDVIGGVFDDIQGVYDTDGSTIGLSTGFPDLDVITAGFQPSDLILLAARPAMGKTALALNFARNVAVKQNIPVAIFSCEMPKEQLALRLLSAEANLNSRSLKTANLKETEFRALMEAMGPLSDAHIFIDDTPAITPMEMRAKIRLLQAKHDIGLIIIDYMQLMRIGRYRIENRFQEVSEIVRDVKAFAKESKIPIMALSQLSRAVEQRTGDDRRPRLSDLRESGEFEQTADLVMFLHREDYYEQSQEAQSNYTGASNTELIIAKHRNGPTGMVPLSFRKEVSRFESRTAEMAPTL